MSEEILLKAEHICKNFHVQGGTVSALDDVNLEIYKGETLALVGESGCGKSTLGRTILHLIEPSSGSVSFDGVDLETCGKTELRKMRKRMQIIFQDPFSSLDPRMRVGEIIGEPMKIHNLCKNKREMQEKVQKLMARTGIRPEYYNRYPHQFSGGQRQRIGIARALSVDPDIIVCDEPVSALDVSIQAQILNLLQDLQEERKLTYLFISHDLSVVRYIADRVSVMFLGRMCEIGPAEDVYTHPLHPYTKCLLDAVPLPDPSVRKEDEEILSGEIPSPLNPPEGCRFHTRCPYATEECRKKQPEWKDMGNGRFLACHHPLQV